MTLRPLHFTADQTPLPPCANRECSGHLSPQNVAEGEIFCSEECQWDVIGNDADTLFDDPEQLDAEEQLRLEQEENDDTTDKH